MPIRSDHILCLCDFETTGVDTEHDEAIEVAIVFLDAVFNPLGTYDSLIVPGRFAELCPSEARPQSYGGWGELFAAGFAFHKIDTDDVKSEGRDAATVVAGIRAAMRRAHLQLTERLSATVQPRYVLLSDNIQFEWQFMKRLFRDAGVMGREWPFHYCGWDTSLLLEMTGVGDPAAMIHRALPDCLLTLDAIRKAQAHLDCAIASPAPGDAEGE